MLNKSAVELFEHQLAVNVDRRSVQQSVPGVGRNVITSADDYMLHAMQRRTNRYGTGIECQV